MSDKKNLLKERAEKLARSIQTQREDKDVIEVLVFKLDQEFYAVEVKYIQEVYPYKTYTTLPSAPDFIFGLINVRRKILSIVDLKIILGLHSDQPPDKKAIILEDSNREFALLTEGIIGIRKIPIDQIQPSLPTFARIKQDFIQGVTSDRSILLDGKKLLNSELLIVNETEA